MLSEILIILVLVMLNGLLAMAEISVVSSRKTKLEGMAKRGIKGALIALELRREPEKFLSAIQTGITLIGIIAGVYGGTQIAEDIIPLFSNIEYLKPYSKQISFTVVVALITYLSIVIGELVPKTVAFSNPERIAVMLSPLLKLFLKLATPVVQFLSFSTKVLSKIFSIRSGPEPPLTDEELFLILEQGVKDGSIEGKESELMKSIIRLGDMKAYSIMTKRQEIVWLDINDSAQNIAESIRGNSFSKYLVCEDEIENVLGYITVKAYYEMFNSSGAVNLKDIIMQPLFIPDYLSAIKVLDKFKETKIYLAVVIDEYGTFEGIITLHDVLENIVGEMPELFESESVSIIRREDGSYLVEGTTELSELNEFLGIKVDDKDSEFSTIAGFMLFELQKIPRTGEKFNKYGYQFEVIDMDGNRIDKVLITRLK
jgi:putative hemolysin